MKGQRPKLIIGSAKHELIRVVDAVIDHASSFGVETDKVRVLLRTSFCDGCSYGCSLHDYGPHHARNNILML